MAKIKLQGNASGTGVITLTAPNTSTDRTVTLPDEDITLGGGVDGIVSTADGTAITIDSAENVGIGVVPETWLPAKTALQLGGNAALYAHTEQAAGKWLEIGQNTYQQADSDIAYISTDEASAYRQHNGTHTFKVAPSGSADAAISFTTGFEVLNDGKARAANGLLFGTDTAAANTLDDYEEGTFTPNVGGDATYTNQNGSYTKVGRLVTVKINFQVNAINSSGKNIIYGLPFTSTSGAAHVGSVGYYSGLSVSPTWIGCYGDANNTQITFIWNTGNSLTIGANGQNLFQNSARIDLSLTYQTT